MVIIIDTQAERITITKYAQTAVRTVEVSDPEELVKYIFDGCRLDRTVAGFACQQVPNAADNAAGLPPARSVLIDTPRVPGGRWRIRLRNPHNPEGPGLETYLRTSEGAALRCAQQLLAGAAVDRREG